MITLSKKKFLQKMDELNIVSKQSLFFKTNFFYKFTCNPFCKIYTIKTQAPSSFKLEKNVSKLSKQYAQELKNSKKLLVHFRVREEYPFLLMQEIMKTIQKKVSSECYIDTSVHYTDKYMEGVYIFLEL